jgi:hypothetical protein
MSTPCLDTGDEGSEATLDKLDRMFQEAATHLSQGHLDKT